MAMYNRIPHVVLAKRKLLKLRLYDTGLVSAAA